MGHTPRGVAVADLNHDGKGDIVVAEEEDNDVLVLLGKSESLHFSFPLEAGQA